MKRPIVLLSLLSSVMMFSPQSMGMEESKEEASTVGKGGELEASSFTQDLRVIVDNYGNNKDQLQQLVKKQYDDQIELQEDLIKDGGFSNDERTLLFDIAKELNLPIIVGTDSRGISLFSIYKGQSIENLTTINHGPYHITSDQRYVPGGLKLATFFISDHFTSLKHIGLYSNKLTDVKLPINLPYLECLKLESNQLTQLTLGNMPKLDRLYLLNNQLTQLKLGDMPKLNRLYLQGNKIKKLNFLKSNMPNLRHLELENNPLKNLTLPYAVSHHTGLINKDWVMSITFNGVIPSITAFYCSPGAGIFNEEGIIVAMEYFKSTRKKHTFRKMNFLNEVERERNCHKISRWMVARNRS